MEAAARLESLLAEIEIEGEKGIEISQSHN